MSARPYDPTAEQKARAQLSTAPGLSVLTDATPEALLQGIIVLTHRIQASDTARVAEPERTADLRAQRDLCRAELLSRIPAAEEPEPVTAEEARRLCRPWSAIEANTLRIVRNAIDRDRSAR